MMTLPGAPCVYYGDEIGLSAGGDPYCRAAFPWHDTASWNQDLLAHYKKAISLRNKYPVLRIGNLETLYADGMVFAFHRKLDEQQAIVVLNAGDKPAKFEISMQGKGWGQDSGENWCIADNLLMGTVSARDTLILVNQVA
jgi:neopullulanase